MCGIAGTVRFDSQPVSKTELLNMREFLAERGPDGNGMWQSGGIGLVHTRLSIVDLSELGSQPMTSDDSSCVITFNGEIFNFKILRDELAASGVEFKSGTDTEVLLSGYRVWGIEELLSRIDGQFAFVLTDVRARKSYACRDRFGQKPLYYHVSNSAFKFSSDIRSIAATETGLELDHASIDYYLTELSAPQPKTIYKSVAQVRPAHYLVIDQKQGKVDEHRYWALDFENKLEIDIEESESRVEAELEKAVVRRIHGDVPIGSFLSGGVDSGLVTAFLAKNSSERIQTFTVGFGHKDYDESGYAKSLANRYDTDHTQLAVEPHDLTDVVDKLIDYCGEPFADSSLIPSFYICEAISSSIKVALSGDGGDEFFGGYYDYAFAFETDRYLSRAEGRSVLANKIALLSNKIGHRAGLNSFNQGVAIDYAGFSGAERLHRKMGFSFAEKPAIYNTSFAESAREFAENYLDSVWNSSNKISITDNLLEASLSTRLVNDYLVKVDRASMINSLEVRSPFMDHHLAELAASIPSDHHLHGGNTKYLTKRIAKRLIADDIFERSKQGFGIPLKEWLRTDLYEHVKSVLSEEKLSSVGILQPGVGLRMLDEHRSGSSDHTNKLWALFCLETWLRGH